MSQILFCKHGNNKMDFEPCQKCCREKVLIEKINEIVAEKGGLWFYDNSEKIILASSHLFICKKNHIWKSQLVHIKKGNWCAICSKLMIAHQIAEERNGRCLSEKYVGSQYHLKWECFFRHTWFASFSNVNQGTWCPKCNISIGEETTRIIFEILFDTKFIKIKPKWLNGLELDGYCEKLNIAFEYDGKQHYEFIKFFHRTEEEFLRRVQQDKLKDKLCEKYGVILLRIPYTVKLDDLKDYIVELCGTNDIFVPNNVEITSDDLKDIYKPNEKKLEKIRKIVESKGGTLLSDVYVNNTTKIEIRCKKNHIWRTTPRIITDVGSWCPECVGTKKHTIEKMQEVAESKNGKCLSKEYDNAHANLLWQCSQKHCWPAPFHSIRKGSWCPCCYQNNRKRKTRKNNNYVEV